MLDRNGRGNPEYAINGHFSLPPRQERVVRFNRPFEGRAKSTLSLKMASSSRVPAISGTTTIEATRLCRITSVELR